MLGLPEERRSPGRLGEVAMKDGWGQLTGASCVSKFSPHLPLDWASFSSVCMNGRSGDGGRVHRDQKVWGVQPAGDATPLA